MEFFEKANKSLADCVPQKKRGIRGGSCSVKEKKGITTR